MLELNFNWFLQRQASLVVLVVVANFSRIVEHLCVLLVQRTWAQRNSQIDSNSNMRIVEYLYVLLKQNLTHRMMALVLLKKHQRALCPPGCPSVVQPSYCFALVHSSPDFHRVTSGQW
jgi:hypothetical protein